MGSGWFSFERINMKLSDKGRALLIEIKLLEGVA